MPKLINHASHVNLHKDCKIVLNIFLAINDPNLLVMLNKVSFDVLKFWIHQSSFYYVDKILLVKTPKTKLYFTYSPNGLVQIPLQSSWLNLQVVQIWTCNHNLHIACSINIQIKKNWQWWLGYFLGMLKHCDGKDNHGNYNQQFFIIHGELKLEKKNL